MKLDTQALTRSFGRAVLNTKAKSPHIFFALGVVSVLGGTVLAAKATLKLEETVEDISNDITNIKELSKSSPIAAADYSDAQYYKDMTYIYAKASKKLVKLYGPAILATGVGIACLTGSHVQLTRRNTALTVTLAAVSKAYNEYREKVRSEIGEEKEETLYKNITEKMIEIDGEKKKVKTSDGGYSPYARVFDVFSTCWEKDPEVNKIFLECQQRYLNRLLEVRGHVMLNDVYDKLGLERTPAGAIVGWVYKGDGDNYIDFDLNNPANHRFLMGHENSVWLDFNVDGVVWDMIGKERKW
jgi:hypothetical protein